MDNPQIELAQTLIESTSTHLFLTGKAGTGKTTFLRRLCSESPKRMVVLAPTGIAAINAGGVTIHSFFQLPFSPYVPGANYAKENEFKMQKSKIELIRSIDLLVIDEISMVRADLLDAVDNALCRFRHSRKPFGGVQLLLIGDLQQLSPVIKDEEWNMLRPYYDTPYFFSSLALKRTNYVTIELEKVYRQSDSHFLSLLNIIREGHADQQTLNELNRRYVPNFSPKRDDGYIRLVTHNWQAQDINTRELERLQEKTFTYHAQVQGKFPEYSYPTDQQLTLKRGAQVMFVKNDTEKRFFNGMIGEVAEIDKDGFRVRPNTDSDTLIDVRPEEWTNTRYALDEQTKEIKEVVDGTFMQYPVKLAWAITIHKSQGLTFERVMIEASRAFAPGQTYVALSRCKTLEGIVLTSPIPPSAIIADPHIEAFNRDMRSHTLDKQQLRQMRNSYSLQLLTNLFTFENERIALAQIVRLLEEHLAKTYPDTLLAYQTKLRDYDLQVIAVSSRFHQQYERLLAEHGGSVEFEQLQERVMKGADYFVGHLYEVRGLASTTRLDIDNAEVARRMRQALGDLAKCAAVHIKQLEYVRETGFHTKHFLNARAKALLEADNKTAQRKSTAKGTHHPTPHEQPKQTVPTEVKDAALYYRLQQWRKQKAAESGKPAYAFLQTKAMMAMANYAPTTPQALAAIPYFGKKSMDLFGADLLTIIRKYVEEKKHGPTAENDPDSEEAAKVMAVKQPGEKTENVTLRLYKAGHTPAQIATLREYTVSTIMSHLAKFIPTGEVKFDDLVPATHFGRIKAYLAAHQRTPETTLTDVREAIGDDITFGELRLTIERLGW